VDTPDNCNGQIDEGVLNTYYQDSDGDGFGNPSIYIQQCTQPIGYVSDNNDCDDANSAINPNTLWYPDFDGDGYGNPSVSRQQCTQPAGYVLNNTDYNDYDPYIYPGGPAVRVVGTSLSYYTTLQAAYNAAANGDTIQAQVGAFTENLAIDLNKTITLTGGYDDAFTTNPGNTTLKGNLTISNGKLFIRNFVVLP
jgi:hypothetical protein